MVSSSIIRTKRDKNTPMTILFVVVVFVAGIFVGMQVSDEHTEIGCRKEGKVAMMTGGTISCAVTKDQ